MDKQQEKRSAKGGGSVRQRPDGKWEARCTINGKSRSFYADKQSEALKKMREAQNSKDNGLYFEPNKVTVGEWMDIWLEEYSKPRIRPSSYVSRKLNIENHIKPILGKIKLQSLNTTQIQTFLNNLVSQKELNPSTVELDKAYLHTALDQAVKLRYITVNPADACVLPRKEKEEIKPLTNEETKKFLTAIDGHGFQALFTVTLFTGMRMGEVLGLPWDAIDFKSGTITIKQQLCKPKAKGSEPYIGPTKNGKSRTIMPAPFVMEILKKVRQEQLANHLAVGMAWQNQWNLVFTNKLGARLTHSTIGRHYKIIVNQIGRPDARFHDLRHTYAVNALQEGDSPKTIQQNLGHATATFTMNVYAHVSDKMRQDSANRMQEYYERLKA